MDMNLLAGRRPARLLWMAGLSLGLAAAAASASHAAPIANPVRMAQGQQGDIGEEQDTGMSGSQAGPQSGGPAINQHDEKQQPQGPAGNPGSGASGSAEGQAKPPRADTGKASSNGGSGMSDSARGAAANSDKGPGHRGNDTKPGH